MSTGIDVHLSAGGVRGIAVASMLQRVSGPLEQALFELPDVPVRCTGVSVGAILTLALASPNPEQALADFVSIARSKHVDSRVATAICRNVTHRLSFGLLPAPRVRDIMPEIAPGSGAFGDISNKYEGSAVCYCEVTDDGVKQHTKKLLKNDPDRNLQFVRDSAAVPGVMRNVHVGASIDGAAASIFGKQRIVDSLTDLPPAKMIIVVSCRPWIRRLDWTLRKSSLRDASGDEDDGFFHIRQGIKARDGDCLTACFPPQIVNQYMTMACCWDMISVQKTLGVPDSVELEGVQLLYRQGDTTYATRPKQPPYTPMLLIAPYENVETALAAKVEVNLGDTPETFGLYGTYHDATLTHCTDKHITAMQNAGELMAKVASAKYTQAIRELALAIKKFGIKR